MTDTANWTLEQFAEHYADTLAAPADGWGQHVSPIFGQSHWIMNAATLRFSTADVQRAFAEAVARKGI
jgi:hypothetical protein